MLGLNERWLYKSWRRQLRPHRADWTYPGNLSLDVIYENSNDLYHVSLGIYAGTLGNKKIPDENSSDISSMGYDAT